MLRRRLSILLAAVMMLAMALASAGMATADQGVRPGNGKGVGLGQGGGDVAHPDPGKHNAKGGGTAHNPHTPGFC